MLVGFDPAKSGRNEGERGFGFLFAARVFNGDTLERPDRRRDYGEERIAAIGRIEAECFAVVYMEAHGGGGALSLDHLRTAGQSEGAADL